MIPSKVVATITERMRKMFSNIGVSNGTAMPPSKNNRDHLAWEMYQARELLGLAEKRNKTAMQSCIDAGLFPDHTKNPYPPGTEQTVYLGEHMVINVKVNNSSPRFDATRLKGVLLRHKISSEIADRIYEECMKDGPSPAHTFRAVPIVGDK